MKNLIIYRSSAGSGKTYALVKEYLTMVLKSDNPSKYRQILAITFTNKAAAELKERIVNQLMGFAGLSKEYRDEELVKSLSVEIGITEEELQEKSSAALHHMLYNYGDLSISTIDKFVVKILRYFHRELDLSDDFSVELNVKNFVAIAVERMMMDIGLDPVVTKMALSFARQKSDGEKSWRIEGDINKIALLMMTEEGQKALKKLESVEEKGIFDYQKNVQNRIKELDLEITALGKKTVVVHDSYHLPEKVMYSNIPKFFRGLEKQRNLRSILPSDSVHKNMESEEWWTKSGKSTDEVKAQISTMREELKPMYNHARELLMEYLVLNLFAEGIAPLMFVKRVHQKMEEIKEEQNIVIISDNNKLISNVITDNPSPFIYEKLGERYRHFMIDEFQDTSIVQWHNLVPLVEESLANGFRNILVGDVKQSIYRFRGGEMEQLAQLPKIYQGGETHRITETVFANNLQEKVLEYNYRSRKEIVMFNNELFTYMVSRLGDRVKSLYDHHEQIPVKGHGGHVMMKELEATEELSQDELMIEEINNIVEECVGKGYRYGDIAVLVYKNKVGQMIAENFTNQGIEVVSTESLLLKNQKSISFIMALFGHIHSPDNEFNRLLILNYLHENVEGSMHEFLKKYIGGVFTKVFASLEIDFDRLALSKLDVFSLAERLCLMFELDASEAYMMEFLNICSGFVRKDAGSVSAFLDYWELNANNIALQSSENINAINIMTVHKSKGLEFPVVINPYVFKRIKKYTKKYLWVEEEDTLPVKLLKPNELLSKTDYALMEEEERYKTRVDALNTLYVATTRASEALYILFPKLSENVLKKNPDRVDCLMYSFCRSKNGSEEYREGDLMDKHYPDAEIQMNTTFANYARIDWQTELRIAISDEQKGEELTFGKRLHELIEKTNDRSEIAANMERFSKKVFLSDESHQKLKNELEGVFEIPDFKRWHQESKEVLNEKEILHENGLVLRPDRIFVQEDEVVVVDFKTGIERKSHVKQVEKYVDALQGLGYDNVSGYLLYTGDKKLVQV